MTEENTVEPVEPVEPKVPTFLEEADAQASELIRKEFSEYCSRILADMKLDIASVSNKYNELVKNLNAMTEEVLWEKYVRSQRVNKGY